MRRVAAVIALLVAGCGGGSDGSDEPSGSEARTAAPSSRVTGAVDLVKPRAGAPDAGTAAGHGADGGIGTTSAAAFSFTGRVSPPDSTVRASEGAVRVEPSGRFTVAVASPARGHKQVRIDGTKPGHEPWRIDVRIVRGAPQRVTVPKRDVEAPTAALLLEPGAGSEPIVSASPSRQDDRNEAVTLPRPSFRATAVARDAEGGTGRIRLSVAWKTRCDSKERSTVKYMPPAQIANVALPPGASAPVERQRSARIRLDAGEGCTVTGEAWAEATDAHGLQAVTRHVAFKYP